MLQQSILYCATVSVNKFLVYFQAGASMRFEIWEALWVWLRKV